MDTKKESEEFYKVLIEQNERFNFIVESTRTATWEWNVQTGNCIFNKRWAEIIGYTLDEISPTTIETWNRFAHPDDLKNGTELIEKHFRGETDYYEFETRMKHKDGHWIWVFDRGKVSKWTDDGKPLWMFGTHHDITKRKQTEEALLQSKDLLLSFISHSPIYTYIKEVTPTESRVIMASENFHEMIGIPGSQMTGKTMQELFPPEFAAKISADDWEVASMGKLINIEEELNGRYYTTFKYPIKEGDQFLLAGYTIDLTERKQTEKQLIESEANARAIMESTDDVLILLDKDGIVIDCNEAHAKRLNTSRNDLLGKNVFDLLPEDVAKNRREHIHEVISTGIPFFSEDFRGEYWNEFVIHPIYIENKITDKIAIFARDITKRKLAEQALRESEARFRNLLHDVHAVSVQGYAPNGTTQYWNQASEQLYGYTMQEAIGNNLLELIIPAEMRNDVAYAIHQMAETGQPIPSSELSLMRKDGSRVTVFSSHTIVKSAGKPQELFCIDIDLTELKKAEEELRKSEEKFREMANLLPQIIFESDAEGKLLYVNKQAYKTLGYSEKYPIVGLNTLDFYTPESRLKAIENIRGKVSGKLKNESNEYVMIRKDGSTFPVLVYSNPILKDNKPVGLRGIIVDITDLKQFEAEIKLINENLIQLNATKDKFFSIISHDLKSPFNTILGFSNLLIEKVQNKDLEAVEEYAWLIQKASTKAMDLLSNLLVWSRSQTGKMEFKPENVEIGSLINATADLLNDTAKQKSIIISNKCQQNLTAFADKAMIGTILRNLMSNAIKFTHPGGEVVISAKLKRDEIEIVVSDNGVGIKKEAMEKLFRIDESYSTTGTQNEVGTGLGLLLCKEFVEKHGGKIGAKSEEKKGSTFYFTIPNIDEK
jgi:PAS domain S-box-containing protein